MADEKATLLLEVITDVSSAQRAIGTLKDSLSKLTIPKNLTDKFETSFNKLGVSLEKYQEQLDKGFTTKADLKNLTSFGKDIENEFKKLEKYANELESKDIRLKIDLEPIKEARKKLEEAVEAKKKLLSESSIDNFLGNIGKAGSKSTKVQDLVGQAKVAYDNGDFEKFRSLLSDIQNKFNELKSVDLNNLKTIFKDIDGIDSAKSKIDAIKIIFDELNKTSETTEEQLRKQDEVIEQLANNYNKINTKALNDGADAAHQTADAMSQARAETDGFVKSTNNASAGVLSLNEQVDQLKSSTQYFFGLRNMLRLLRRGFRQAVDVIKELDKAMTATAVVTKYSVGDMWAMLPEYTANANALGTTIQSMYEATTLYYQQGLNTQQAIALSNETLKMARIAGLDAADATDAMTAALRGFNMEINEESAQRINDVYSKLAANTASNVEELSTAMEKTASLAHSAGMSFEGTAAFLAQAIETTREAPENLGTAMKTVIARFQEIKKNPLEMVEVEGEEVSYNKVDSALQSIGVSLKDANGQFRALDQVFLEIAQKWDTLTQTQQRYIATTAAGSRQQSRFIAMMSNYSRTVELMGYANNSAGASNEQFQKTMDSLEAKLNKLKNAWNEFLMSLANDKMVKFFVDGLTKGITLVNKLTSALSFGSGTLRSFLSIFLALKGLKLGGKLVNFGIRELGGFLTGNKDTTNPAQASLISNPIVQKLAELIGIESRKGENAGAGAKGATDLNVYAKAQGKISEYRVDRGNLTTEDLTKTQEGLSGKELKTLMSANPDIGKGIEQAIKAKGIQVNADDLKMVMSGQMSYKDFAGKYNITETGTFTEQYNKLMSSGVESDKIKASNMAEEFGARLTEEINKAGVEVGSDAAKEIEKNLNESYNKGLGDINLQKPVDNIAKTLQSAGSATMSFGMSIQALGGQIAQANPLLGNMITKMGGLVTTLGSGINGIGSLANLIGGPATAAIGIAMAAISAAIYLIKKHRQAISDQAKEVSDNYKKVRDETSKNISNLKEWKDEFIILSKGVDKNGNNVNLSTEEYDRYLEIVNGIAEINPSIVEGYNEQGNAIIRNNEALEETLRLEQERAKINQEQYTSSNSLNKLIKARNQEQQYKNAQSPINWFKTVARSIFGGNGWVITQGLLGNRDSSNSDYNKTIFQKQIQDLGKELRKSEMYLNQEHRKQLNAILSNYDIDINALMKGDEEAVNAYRQNFDKINNELIGYASAKGLNLGEAYMSGIADFGDTLSDYSELNQPIYDWLNQAALKYSGYDEIAPELKSSLQSLYKEIVDTSDSQEEIESRAKQVTKDFADATTGIGEFGGEYVKAMKLAENAQDLFAEDFNEELYKRNATESISILNTLAREAREKYGEAGEAIAEFYENEAAKIEKFAEGAELSLESALNSMTDKFKSAEGALERFESATEKDYSTLVEGYKSIFDEVFKETDEEQRHTLGYGDQTFWAGAKELLGLDRIKEIDKDTAIKEMKNLESMLQGGEEGWAAFYNAVAGLDEDARERLEALGVTFDENSDFFSHIPADAWADVAREMGMAEDTFTALMSMARQWTKMDFVDYADTRKIFGTNGQGVVGKTSTTVDGKTITDLYVKQETLENALLEAGYTWKEIPAILEHMEANGIKAIPPVGEEGTEEEVLSVLNKAGISNTEDLLDKLVATGDYTKDELAEYAKLLDPDNFDPEEFAEAYADKVAELDDSYEAKQTSALEIISSIIKEIAKKLGVKFDEGDNKKLKNKDKNENNNNNSNIDVPNSSEDTIHYFNIQVKQNVSEKLEEANETVEYLKENIETLPDIRVKYLVTGEDGLEETIAYYEELLKNPNITPEVKTEVENAEFELLQQQINLYSDKTFQVKLGLNTNDFESSLQWAKNQLEAFEIEKYYGNIGAQYHRAKGQNQPGYYSSVPSAGSAAKGTKGRIGPKGHGGLTLTGEEGYEIAWLPSEGRSTVLGVGGPQLVNLPANAVVWSHEQSEDIIKRKGLPMGSAAGNTNISDVILPGSGGGGSKKSSKKSSGSSSSSNSKEVDTIIHFTIEEVVRFNLDQKIENLSTQIAKNTKQIEESLERAGTTTKTISKLVKKQTNDFKTLKNYNLQLAKSYEKQLNDVLKNGYKEKISWTNADGSKGEGVSNIGGYLKKDKNGNYYIDQNAISNIANIAQRKATFEAVQSAFEPWISGMNSAKKAADDAEEEMKEFAKTQAETFFLWEKQINRLYAASNKLDQVSGYAERYANTSELLLNKVGVGIGSITSTLNNLNKVRKNENTVLKESLKATKENISASRSALKDLVNEKNSIDVQKANVRKQYSNGTITKEERDEALKQLGNQETIQTMALGYMKNVKTHNDGTMTFDIDWSQFDKDSKTMKKDDADAIEEYLNEIIKANNDLNEAIDQGNEQLSNLIDTYEAYEATIIEMEDLLIQGIDKQMQKEIDNAKTLSETITNSLKNLYDNIKKKLDERRKQEDNQKTEEDISRKQERLAMLRADTSGGHALEIAQLQKEISEAQQSYQRTREDQLLDSLQNQADKAAEQREEQIKIMEIQKNLSLLSGVALMSIEKWLTKPAGYQNEIIEALKYANDYDSAPPHKQAQILNEIMEQVTRADDAVSQQKELKAEIQQEFKVTDNSGKNTLFGTVLKSAITAYKTGGLNSQTGPAWLDGTASKPELVLNAQDTKNFLMLRDVLSGRMSNLAKANKESYVEGVPSYEININVDHLNNDYDVDKVAERVKKIIVKDSSYRNVAQVRKFR